MRVRPRGNSLIIIWDHPPEGQPSSKYLVTYTLIVLNGPFSKQHSSFTVPSSNKTKILDRLNLTPGRVHTIVVTAVSSSSYQSSDPVTCKFNGGLCKDTVFLSLVPTKGFSRILNVCNHPLRIKASEVHFITLATSRVNYADLAGMYECT